MQKTLDSKGENEGFHAQIWYNRDWKRWCLKMNKIVKLQKNKEHDQIVFDLVEELENKEIALKNKEIELKSKALEIEEQKLLIKHYEEQFKLFQQRLFGTKSEKTRDDAQGTLFNEAEAGIEQPVPADDVEKEFIAQVSKTKQKGHKHEQLDKLPQEILEYTLDEGDKVCPTCQSKLVHMKCINRRELVIIPATVSVRNHKQEVCVCSMCVKSKERKRSLDKQRYRKQSYLNQSQVARRWHLS